MKRCTKCKEIKSILEFSQISVKNDKKRSWCKKCNVDLVIKTNRTKEGLVANIYRHQIRNSKMKNRNLPAYSFEELKSWFFNQEKFHKLYENWVNSNYKKDLVPSVDRKDNYLPYSFDNIQLMIWLENKLKGEEDMRLGILIHGNNPQKPVIQYDKQGNFIAEYPSASQASRKTEICRRNISVVCRGGRKHAGGFKWEFKN